MNSGKFILGIGIGIILSTICMYTAYSFKLKSDSAINDESYIISKATELGMVFAENSDDEIITNDLNSSDEESVQPKTEQVQNDDGPTISPEIQDEPYNDEQDSEQTDNEEPSLETIPAAVIESTAEPIQNPEPTPLSTPEPTPLPTVKPTPVVTKKPTDPPIENYEGYKGIYIPPGSNATSISNKLVSAGIISDSKAFVNYLIDNALTKKIKTGTFYIPDGADFETIVKILRRQQ